MKWLLRDSLLLMDNELFLQYLRQHSLEEGRAYIQAHVAELTDYAAIGVLIKDESRYGARRGTRGRCYTNWGCGRRHVGI
jgi:hypothetical protein